MAAFRILTTQTLRSRNDYFNRSLGSDASPALPTAFGST
jgi:hypothetical protein